MGATSSEQAWVWAPNNCGLSAHIMRLAKSWKELFATKQNEPPQTRDTLYSRIGGCVTRKRKNTDRLRLGIFREKGADAFYYFIFLGWPCGRFPASKVVRIYAVQSPFQRLLCGIGLERVISPRGGRGTHQRPIHHHPLLKGACSSHLAPYQTPQANVSGIS